jgi:hypothetical protein
MMKLNLLCSMTFPSAAEPVLDGVGALCLGNRHDHQKGNMIAINAEVLELFGLAGRWNEEEAGELAVAETDSSIVRICAVGVKRAGNIAKICQAYSIV